MINVAQVSKPAVSRVSKPASRTTSCAAEFQKDPFRVTGFSAHRYNAPRSADLEFGDTAGLETCAACAAPQLILSPTPARLFSLDKNNKK